MHIRPCRLAKTLWRLARSNFFFHGNQGWWRIVNTPSRSPLDPIQTGILLTRIYTHNPLPSGKRGWNLLTWHTETCRSMVTGCVSNWMYGGWSHRSEGKALWEQSQGRWGFHGGSLSNHVLYVRHMRLRVSVPTYGQSLTLMSCPPFCRCICPAVSQLVNTMLLLMCRGFPQRMV